MKEIDIILPSYSTHKQSFNFRPVVLPEIAFDEKKALLSNHPVTQSHTRLAQFDTAEPQLC